LSALHPTGGAQDRVGRRAAGGGSARRGYRGRRRRRAWRGRWTRGGWRGIGRSGLVLRRPEDAVVTAKGPAGQSMPWMASVLTLFPEAFPGPLGLSLAGRGLER